MGDAAPVGLAVLECDTTWIPRSVSGRKPACAETVVDDKKQPGSKASPTRSKRE
jgi:hypothetical protein